MSRAAFVGWVVLGVAGGVGCATKSLPPGTPPPEYEKRSFEPWPPADAGVDAAEPDAAAAPSEARPPDADAGSSEPSDPPPYL